ncbi:ABC transporter permease [Alloacidobacterium dinghuense]|uniref:ABC transporter permease n=1 Tax=Alloacidobacterium dinghuense TaxID=2763107 RepID=A0A7G8BL01_9BACT|nr:ABC transporter permease [Alloacidobacterium dinghuense]QNI33221.1 ABC transporter permease [Alloacidobacterium dinghuense]
MKFLAYFLSLAGKLVRRSHIQYDMEEEFLSHIHFRIEDLERSGLDRAEAERRARIEFGGYEKFRQESYESLGSHFFETLLQDARFSLRILRKSPGFTIISVLTLALAIGANAVVFAVLNAMILRPLNVPQAQSLYAIERGSDKAINHSYPDYVDLRDRNRSFDDLAAYNVTGAGLDTGKDPSGVWSFEVTGNYFDVLRIRPYLGRFFHRTDEHGPNSAPYIVLSYAYWHSHFQDDRNAVGRVVQLNRHPFTILGVAPPEFKGTLLFAAPDIWVPIVNQEQVEGTNVLNERGYRGILMVMGHLKKGVTPLQAISDLNSIGAYLEKSYPKDDGQMTFYLTRPYLAGDWLGDPVREFLAGLMLLAGLILLAACANLGSLFAARAADRGREVALRLALGSSRRRILRQVFTEAILISLIGGIIGLAASVMLLRWLSVWRPLPGVFSLHIPADPDAKVYVVALLLAFTSGLLFAAVPVRQILRTNPYEVVKSGPAGRFTRATGSRITVQDLLLVAQIAICAVLVTSSMVAVRGLIRSLHSNFGFEPKNAMLVGTNLMMAGYSGDRAPLMQKRMIEGLKTIPGVQAVGLVDRSPLYYGANSSSVFTDTTTDLRPKNAVAEAMLYNISPEYFDAARTALLAGRSLTWHDDRNASQVAVVNREFADRIFGSVAGAVGGYFKRRDGTRIQVVGIVENGKYGSITEDLQPAMFLPIMQQTPVNETLLVVRSSRDPKQLTAALRSKLHELDAGLPADIQTWDQQLYGALFAARMATISLGVLGVMGAMLSITGIFGMAAYSVSKRLRELGIRVALGAQRVEVLQAALGRAFKLLALGSALGLFLGLLATKVLAFIVYQATPRDPLVLAGVVLIMLILGLVATWIPAQRALSVSPLILLREE